MSTPNLPQLHRLYATDGGMETTLVFLDGLDLPHFAAFPLVDADAGEAVFTRYFTPYLDVAERNDIGFVLDTPTWRANLNWAELLGYDAAVLRAANQEAVELARVIADGRPSVPVVIDGVVGPRGDGYDAGIPMTAEHSAEYHWPQVAALASAGVDMVSAITMTNVQEAIGIVQAADSQGIPVVVSFTTETDGLLPNGETLADAIASVDMATAHGPAYYMVNCAHPTHFLGALDAGQPWLHRVKGVRANASAKSHQELDEASTLDRGHPAQLARQYCELDAVLPDLCVVGGCCGTDHEHVSRIADALAACRATIAP